LQFTYPWASMKAVQTTREAFSPQKKHSALQYMEFINRYLFFWVIFSLLNLDPQFGSDSILVANLISQSGIYELFSFLCFYRRRPRVHLKFIDHFIEPCRKGLKQARQRNKCHFEPLMTLSYDVE
jgi:hypothetical protein